MKTSLLPVKVVVLLVLVSACRSCDNPSFVPTLIDAIRMSTIVLQGVAVNHTAGPTTTSPIVLVSVECIFKDTGTEIEPSIKVVEVGDKTFTGLCFESELIDGSKYLLFLRDRGDGSYTQQAAALDATTAALGTGCDLGGAARKSPTPKGVDPTSFPCPDVTYNPCPSTTTPHSSGRRTKAQTSRPHNAPTSTATSEVTTPNDRKHPRTGNNSSSRPVAMATLLLGAMMACFVRTF